MEFNITKFLEAILLPPNGLFILVIAGFILIRRSMRVALILMGSGFTLMYLLSTPLIASLLSSALATEPALDEQALSGYPAQAIVILGGGRDYGAPEYAGDTVSTLTLQRVRYGAWLKRRTFLPLYVSGGRPGGELRAEAELMQSVLQKDFGVEVNGVETESKTTYENALYTSTMLKKRGITRIFLVTTANHMPRSTQAFEHFGIEAIPAPTGFYGSGERLLRVNGLVASTWAYRTSVLAIHEMAGRMWYWVRYY